MTTSIIRINNLREVVGNLEYLIEISTDRSNVGEYSRQLEIYRSRLAAAIGEMPNPAQPTN